MKKWSIVQDLMPFGYRVEGESRFLWLAHRKASVSKYLIVMSSELVLAENKRLLSSEEFEKELEIFKKKRGF